MDILSNSYNETYNILAIKNPVYDTLPFRGESNSFVSELRFNSVVNKMYYTARITITEKRVHASPFRRLRHI